MKLIVNEEKCPQNHKCPSIVVCPQGAIRQKDIYSLPEVDGGKCILRESTESKILHIQA